MMPFLPVRHVTEPEAARGRGHGDHSFNFLVHHWGCDWGGLKYLKHQYYKPFYSLPMEAVK